MAWQTDGDMAASDKQLVAIADKAILDFKGDTRRLSNAIGYLFIGRQFGWRAMYVMHDRRSIRDYEKILGIDSKDPNIFPDDGPLAHKSVAHEALKKVTNFWKAVRGEVPGIRSTAIK